MVTLSRSLVGTYVCGFGQGVNKDNHIYLATGGYIDWYSIRKVQLPISSGLYLGIYFQSTDPNTEANFKGISTVYMHSNNKLNNNQYGFTPQRRTVDVARVAKNFIEESLRLKQCTVVVSLDVKGAFDAAWWPSILKHLKEFECPANLYRHQRATLAIGELN